MRDFVNEKDDGEIHFIDEEEWQKQEAIIFDAKNYYLKGITHNIENTSQVSVAISKLQGLTGNLRVLQSSTLEKIILKFRME